MQKQQEAQQEAMSKQQQLQVMAAQAMQMSKEDLVLLVKDGQRFGGNQFKQKWWTFADRGWQGIFDYDPSHHPQPTLAQFTSIACFDYGNDTWFRKRFEDLPPLPPGTPLPMPPFPMPLPGMTGPPGMGGPGAPGGLPPPPFPGGMMPPGMPGMPPGMPPGMMPPGMMPPGMGGPPGMLPLMPPGMGPPMGMPGMEPPRGRDDRGRHGGGNRGHGGGGGERRPPPIPPAPPAVDSANKIAPASVKKEEEVSLPSSESESEDAAIEDINADDI